MLKSVCNCSQISTNVMDTKLSVNNSVVLQNIVTQSHCKVNCSLLFSLFDWLPNDPSGYNNKVRLSYL